MKTILEQLNEAVDKLDEAIEWNFGTVGNDPRANNCLEKVDELKQQLKKSNTEIYNKFIMENE